MSWDDGYWDDGYWDGADVPPVTVTTQRWFDLLPAFYRRADDGRWELLRWLALVGNQLDTIQAEVDDIAAGRLTDPALARPQWVAWLAQMVGITIRPWWSENVVRGHLADTATYYAHGTAAAITAAVIDGYPTATGTTVARHWHGEVWHAVITSTPTQTPATGVYITTFDELERTFPTFGDMETLVPTFDDLATIDRIHLDVVTAASVEEPCGVRLFHLWTADAALVA